VYVWNFGDLSSGIGDSIAHIYQTDGTYDVQVEVTDSNNCIGICNTTVSITNTLATSFHSLPINGCAPLLVDFYNTSTNAITYLWDFGDGSTSILENPSHTYVNPGNYNVSLTGFGTNANATTNGINQIVVLPKPLANIQAFPELITEENDTVYFADNSLDAWSWSWNFGDPSSGTNNVSSIQNPTHIYGQNGSYNISLLVTNSYGCSDSITLYNFINVYIDSTSSLSAKNTSPNYFNVGPNPFENNIQIDLFSKIENQGIINLYNSLGVQLFPEMTFTKLNQKNQYLISTSDLPNGLYIFTINLDGNQYVIKLIKGQ
jgi:PKD repeat protein